jgi:ribonuclease J
VRLAPDGPEKVSEERVGRLVLDGDVILPADGPTVNERRKISVNGLIAVAVPLSESGGLAGELVIRPFGIPIEHDREDFIADAADAARRAIIDGGEEERLREAVRLAVRRCATLWTGKKPIVEVMLTKLDA